MRANPGPADSGLERRACACSGRRGGTKSQPRHCHRPDMRHTVFPEPSSPAFAAVTAHGSGVKAGDRAAALASCALLPASDGTTAPGPAPARPAPPAAEHSSQPYKTPREEEEGFVLPLSPQSLTEDAATSSGFFLRSMAAPAPPAPPSPPGGPAVKRGGRAALSRQLRWGRAGGNGRHLGEGRAGHGRSAWRGLARAERSRPGPLCLWVIPVLELSVEMSVYGRCGTYPSGEPLGMSLCSRGTGAAAAGAELRVPWAEGGGCGQKLAGLAQREGGAEWRSTGFKLGINVDPNVSSLPGASAESQTEARYSYFSFSFVQSGELGGDPW